jgi:hypothetical protein
MLASFGRAALVSARDSLRANLGPTLLLQLVGVAIVASYYGSERTRVLWNEMAAFAQRGGVAYAALSTAFFAALLPWLLSRLSRGVAHDKLRHLPWLLVFWGFIGCVLHFFYGFMAWLFGDNANFVTVLQKVLVDQFVFTPFFAMPLITVAYAWKDADYSLDRARQALGPNAFARRVVPLLGAAWVVWIPAISLVYALPLSLQLPIANLVECLWSLLLLFLTRSDSQTAVQQAVAV